MGWVAPVLTAVGSAYSAHETRKARKEQEAAIKKQEAEAATAKQQAEAAAEKKRREALMRQGMMSTIRTSPFGVDVPATTTKKTLLGQ
jgi:activator of 2-hydroxyglutaryl-CoA dehydratase